MIPTVDLKVNWPMRIPLAKDRWRLAALVGVRAAAGGIGLWTGVVTPGALGMLVLVVSVIVLLYTAVLVAWLATVRVEVWPGRVDVAWLLRRHRFVLSTGSIEGLRPARGAVGRLFAPFNNLGLQFGPAVLGRRERLTVIHLAHGAHLIAVPTVEGRLAIAPADSYVLVFAILLATRRP